MTRRDDLVALRDAVLEGKYQRKEGPPKYVQFLDDLEAITGERHHSVMHALYSGPQGCARMLDALIAQEDAP